jgi:hypothetical protein
VSEACPDCKGTDFEPVSGAGDLAKLILKDWRTWVVAFGAFLASGMLGAALHVRGDATGAGALVGLWLAIRVQRARRCRACKRVVKR